MDDSPLSGSSPSSSGPPHNGGQAAFGQPPGYGLPGYGYPGYPPGMYPPGWNPYLGALAGPRYASAWHRIGAYLIDGFVLGAINAFAQIVFVGISGTALVGSDAGGAVTALLALVILVFVLDALYVVGQEATWGQTVGKRALGIKVVKEDGSPADVDACLIRYVFLFLAPLGLGGLVTVLTVALSDSKQRLGDRAAGTIVVRTD